MIKKVLTTQDIWNYCLSVLDMNDIHNPEHMAKLEKMVVTPGMLLFSMAAYRNKDLIKEGRQIDLNFGNIVYPGQNILLPESIERLVVDVEGKDFLAKGGRVSGVYLEADEIVPVRGFKKEIQYHPDQVQRFADSFGAKVDDVSRLLFAIAYSCNALHEASQFPANEEEKELYDIRESGRLAAYNTVDITLPNGIQEISEEPFSMTLQFDGSLAGKQNSLARISCEQGNRHLYNLNASLFAMPFRAIMRSIAKNYSPLEKTE